MVHLPTQYWVDFYRFVVPCAYVQQMVHQVAQAGNGIPELMGEYGDEPGRVSTQAIGRKAHAIYGAAGFVLVHFCLYFLAFMRMRETE